MTTSYIQAAQVPTVVIMETAIENVSLLRLLYAAVDLLSIDDLDSCEQLRPNGFAIL